MKVCLIKPVTHRIYDKEQFYIDIGLGFLATSLRKAGHEVKILDCPQNRMTLEEFREFVKNNYYNIYGFKVYTHGINMVNQSIQIIKKEQPRSIVIVGGPHPSGVGEYIFNFFPELDYAFRGEAEVSLPMLLDALENNNAIENIPGLIYRKSNKAFANLPLYIKDIDSFGVPAWDLLNLEGYWKKFKHIRYVTGTYVPVITSRGCPFPCTYCEAWRLSGKRVRYHSVEYVLEWIKKLYTDYGIDNFAFVDDALLFNRSRFIEICEGIIKSGMKIRWDCAQNAVRFDSVDRELLTLMERSGCYHMTVAIESGSPRILKDMKRHTDLELAMEKVKLIKKTTNIFLMGYFILGYPTEREEDIRKTIAFAKKLPLDAALFFLFTPHPGTTITESLQRQGIIDMLDFNNSVYTEPSIPLKDISSKKLKFYHRYAYFSFYLRPRTFFMNTMRYFNPLKDPNGVIQTIKEYLL